MSQSELKCSGCGAILKYSPGAEALTCEYCGFVSPLPKTSEEREIAVQEIDYQSFLANATQENLVEVITTKCSTCGAEVTLKQNVNSDSCAFCGTSLVVTNTNSQKLIKPKSLLPFKITDREAHALFKNWINSLWFAPNNLKALARREEGIKGVYLPYWTYDSDTYSRYTGRRGEDYYVSETYTVTENGQEVTKTREVKHTRWYSASGQVRNNFDDVLVVASNSLPEKYTYALEPWDLGNLVPYQDQYLSGFRSESYQVSLASGFEKAKQLMSVKINETIRRDIGGDHQEISSVNTSYSEITFKHILLPVWLSSYRYQDKILRFMVNARTGEVQGERPWSWIKITLAILAGLIVIGVLAVVFQK